MMKNRNLFGWVVGSPALVITLLCVPAILFSQIKIENVHFSFDYVTATTPFSWDKSDNIRLDAAFEYSLTDLFSLEVSTKFDQDGRMASNWPIGAGVTGLNPNYKWNHDLIDGFVGLRLYPVENFHSQSQALRYKENDGFYFTMGYSAGRYRRRSFNLEYYQGVSDSGRVVVDSLFIHYNGQTIRGWGQQFGCGFKMYHSKWLFVDIGVITNAYRLRNVKVTSYWDEDPARNQSSPFYDPADVARHDELVHITNSLGVGLIFRAHIGINLDFKR